MPCQDNYSDGYRNENDPSYSSQLQQSLNEQLRENQNISQQNHYLEAVCCALINELEARGIANEIIQDASKNGEVDILSFWRIHSKKDQVRLAEKLKLFSAHELKLIKKILK